jgi:hypothetical protein
VNTDRDRLLRENEDEARRIKEELLGLREAMLRHENALNALAIERTNLEAQSEDERIEIPPELQAFIPTREIVKTPRLWPKVAVGVLVLIGVLLGLGGLGIFGNDGVAPVARRAVLPAPHVAMPAVREGPTTKGNEATNVKSSSILPAAKANSTSDKICRMPDEVPMNILPGITYTSEISYSMKSSAIALVEANDTPLITLHLSHTPQSFFIPLRTPFRIDNDRADSEQRKGSLMVFADSKKRDVEIRFESRKLPLERKILGVSSSQ